MLLGMGREGRGVSEFKSVGDGKKPPTIEHNSLLSIGEQEHAQETCEHAAVSLEHASGLPTGRMLHGELQKHQPYFVCC